MTPRKPQPAAGQVWRMVPSADAWSDCLVLDVRDGNVKMARPYAYADAGVVLQACERFEVTVGQLTDTSRFIFVAKGFER